ncbi:ABC transporter permease [Aquibacillus koreensis]|uniref:ABC transporter permease n=1 Tax=Aquibacillus koreensis TaxID=279446 RepID=A0A9X3WMP3_9BACI|nr:oligopeptide ABC transporter permease [Aquibacillus koreensis]MCT2535651.1 ABC transporter permease [Aquibacillus koreensis]MDC3420064.1 ABC transporter permease [Aquibacillus koreensis]
MAKDDKKLSKDLFEPIELSADKGEELTRPEISFWKDAWLRLRKNKAAIVGLFLLIFIVFMSLIGPMMNDYDIDQADYDAKNLTPKVKGLEWMSMFDGKKTWEIEGVTVESATEAGLRAYEVDEQFVEIEVISQGNPDNNEYAKIEMHVDDYANRGYDETYFWFGTDQLGRDLWTRTWKGTQISLYIGLLAAIIDMIVGVIYGGVSAYYGGRVDNYMQRFIEILVGIPNLVVVILMIILLKPGLLAITIALTITGWTGMARIVRGQVLKLKNQEFVLASRTLGATDRRILSKHLIPNVTAMIVINTMFTIPSAIFFESFLSFIGLGLQPPIASLGTLIDAAFDSYRTYPYMLVFPAIIISVLMIGFNIVADGIRDALDPKMRK